MNIIRCNLFPGGRTHCLTMSYDDGPKEDARLTEIFRKYGIRGTFHINSRNLQLHIPENVAEFHKRYDGFEVSCHTLSHPFPTVQNSGVALFEIEEDRRMLEKTCGYPVRGMSYPFGDFDERTIAIFRTAGMEYSRTTRATNGYGMPEDFMKWHPTCHHNGGIVEKWDDFITPDRWGNSRLFYIWGHSFEFPQDNNWSMMEEFCKKAGGRDDVWYAENIKIVDYQNAVMGLRFSLELTAVQNPSATDVWFTCNNEKVCCPAGKTISL